MVLALAAWVIAGGLSVGERASKPMKATAMWGVVMQEGPNCWEIYPTPGAADGIGSALVLVEWPSQRAQVTAKLLERIGGTESWRGPWLMFGATPERVYPAGYLRPDERGFVEFGKSYGGSPSDQRIVATVKAELEQSGVYRCDVSFDIDRVAIDGRAGHIGVFVVERSSPYLGLYCESSRVRFEIID